MSYLNQDPQEETCHEVMAKAKINMKKKIPVFRYEAHIFLILNRLLLGCMTLFCGTLRELRQSCLLSTLRLPTPACTRFSLENDGSTTHKKPQRRNQTTVQSPGIQWGGSFDIKEWGGWVETNQSGGTFWGSWNEVGFWINFKQRNQTWPSDPYNALQCAEWKNFFSSSGTIWLLENLRSSWTRCARYVGFHSVIEGFKKRRNLKG